MNLIKELLGIVLDGLKSSKQKRFLILDDCAQDAELIKLAVEKAGEKPDYKRGDRRTTTAQVVHSKAAAYAVLESEKFDFILIDFRLPTPEGWQVFQDVKSLYPDMNRIFVLGCAADLEAVEPNCYIKAIKKNGGSIASALREAMRDNEPMADRRTALATLAMWLLTLLVGYLMASPRSLIEALTNLFK